MLDQFARPDWLNGIVDFDARYAGPEALMKTAFQIAIGNVQQGGGPFSALIADADYRIVEVGWNNVVRSHDSTAHAEIHCIRRAQKLLGTHDLANTPRGNLTFYVSCSPCIQCFGAIYWSGLRNVIASASKTDAESIGFDEGPVSAELWQHAKQLKGIEYRSGYLYGPESKEPFVAYTRANLPISYLSSSYPISRWN
jgi:tRNA(Arg) A34 adenosine deaminase TadA